MTEKELYMKLAWELFVKSEIVLEIRETNECYYVLAGDSSGYAAYHPPYIANKDGEITGTMGSLLYPENEAEYDSAKLILSARPKNNN